MNNINVITGNNKTKVSLLSINNKCTGDQYKQFLNNNLFFDNKQRTVHLAERKIYYKQMVSRPRGQNM